MLSYVSTLQPPGGPGCRRRRPASGAVLTWGGFLGLIVCGLLALSGCTDEEQAKKVDLSVRQETTITGTPVALTYAYLPQYSHKVSYQRHHLLVDYLAQAIGVPIRQIFPDTFDEHIHMVGRGLIDISFVNPFIFVKMADLYGAQPLARVVETSGELNFRGQIICRADNAALRTIADLKGKRLIAVDPSSAGGYLFPWGLILEHGLRTADFAEIAFAPGPGGKQEKVVMAVYSGKYDAGTIREGTLNLLKDKIDLNQIRVLAHSRFYPGWVYAVRQGLDPVLAGRLQEALLALDYHNPEHRRILDNSGFIGAQKATGADFAPIRQLIRLLEVPPSASKATGPPPSRDVQKWSE